jgi:hypothetical protein
LSALDAQPFSVAPRPGVHIDAVPGDAGLLNELKAAVLHNTGDPTPTVKVTALDGGTALGVTVALAQAVVDAHAQFRVFCPASIRRYAGECCPRPRLRATARVLDLHPTRSARGHKPTIGPCRSGEDGLASVHIRGPGIDGCWLAPRLAGRVVGRANP